MSGLKIDGLKEFRGKLKKLGNVDKFFDDVTRKTAVLTMNDFINKTPFDDLGAGEHTKNLWQFPEKLGESIYQIDNTKTSQDGKHAIAGILNYGRGEIRPKKAKRLYIPFSKKAKAKKLGAEIPKGLIWGKDFVMAKKAKAYKGTNFINDIEKKSEKVLTKLMIKKLRKVFK